MIKFRILVSIFIIIINNVTCDDLEEVKQFGLNRARQSYRFNHPPATEDDNRKIPVSVVYDKVIDRALRQQKLVKQVIDTEAKVSSPKIESIVKFPNNSKTSITEERATTETDVNTIKISTDDISNPEPREIKLTFKIPVAVVYDDDLEKDNMIKSRTPQSRVETRLRKTGKRQRKPINKPDEQTIVTIKPFEDKNASDTRTVNNKIEEASSKYTLDDAPKIKTRGQRRRRPQVRKLDSNISNVAIENNRDQKYEQTTQTIRSRVQNKYDDPEKVKLIKNTESNSFKIDAETITQETPKKVETTENSSSEITETNKPTKKREHGEPDPEVPIIASENLVYGNTGDFKYSYEGGDGTKAYSMGRLKTSDFDEDVAGEAVEGGFSYKDKEGNDFSISYTADENGYRPVGAHLPTPPPIPPAIARALAYLATKTTPEPVTESIEEQEENTPAPK